MSVTLFQLLEALPAHFGGMTPSAAASALKDAPAYSVLFGPGAAQLEVALQQALSGTEVEAASLRLWDGCKAQLAAAAHAMTVLLPSLPPQAAAAFAGSTGEPAALLPWLHIVSQGLLQLGLDQFAAGPQPSPGAFCGLAPVLAPGSVRACCAVGRACLR